MPPDGERGQIGGINDRIRVLENAPASTYDLWASAPVGYIAFYEGLLNAHVNLPGGASPKWTIIGIDRAVVGADNVADNDGTEGGTENLDTEAAHPAHSGTAVGNHAADAHGVTQPTAHTDVPNHVHPVTDPGHVHDEYRNSATTGALDGWGAGDTSTSTPLLTGYDTGSKVAGISLGNPTGGVASQPHSGTAVADHAVKVHGVTQPGAHAAHGVKKFRRSYMMRKDVA